jgi:DtxR family transcriptional regulator, Mn-dependent transcriptional regulator
MASPTVEDYLKRILLEEEQQGEGVREGGKEGGRLSTGDLAVAMGVTPGSATAMAKTLSESGLVEYEARAGVRLSRRGRKLAMHVLRRHRILELFLVRVLGLDWSEVHKEAEQLEHALSERVLDRLDALLGHPLVDPHGSPIPTAEGVLDSPNWVSLNECQVGKRVRIARVAGEDPQFLRFLDGLGLVPGVEVTVISRETLADAITLAAKDRPPVTLGSAAAARLFVKIES